MNDYEIAVRKWAAQKLGIEDWRWIERVDLEGDTGSDGYSSWTPGEPPMFAVMAFVRDGSGPRAIPRQVLDLDDETIPFDALLGEILAIEVTADDRQQAERE